MQTVASASRSSGLFAGASPTASSATGDRSPRQRRLDQLNGRAGRQIEQNEQLLAEVRRLGFRLAEPLFALDESGAGFEISCFREFGRAIDGNLGPRLNPLHGQQSQKSCSTPLRSSRVPFSRWASAISRSRLRDFHPLANFEQIGDRLEDGNGAKLAVLIEERYIYGFGGQTEERPLAERPSYCLARSGDHVAERFVEVEVDRGADHLGE